MKKIIFTLSFLIVACSLYSQNIAGAWYGALNVKGNKLHLVFHITKTGDTYSSTMDSPDQAALGLSTDKTTVNGNQIVIEAAKFGIKYTATYLPDSNKISGVFVQGAGSLPLTLSSKPTSASAAPPAARPMSLS